MDLYLFIALCLFQLCFLVVSSTEKHLICKEVEDVFNQVDRVSAAPPSSNQGRPGKRGEIGVKGERGDAGSVGPVGPRGEVNYKRVNDAITAKLNEASKKQSPRIDDLEKMMNNLKRGMCRVEYDSKCFWVIFSSVTFFQGQTLCRAFGAEAANIYSKKHYDMVVEYVRSVMPTSPSHIEPWLGMTVDISSLQISLSIGIPAPYVMMYPGFPQATGGHTQINLQVRHNKDTATQNMWNYNPAAARGGILCEIEF